MNTLEHRWQRSFCNSYTVAPRGAWPQIRASRRLKNWKARARKTDLVSMQKFVDTLENWEDWILNYVLGCATVAVQPTR